MSTGDPIASSSEQEKSQEGVLRDNAELLPSVSDPAFTEDLAMALLKRNDLPAEVLERLSKNSLAIKSRKVKRAIIGHPRTPRYISLALLRHLFTFDLMQVALTPAVPGDVKMAAEEALINRLETLSPGERLSLARRASARVAGALLPDQEARVMSAAMDNARLTEAHIIRVLQGARAGAALVRAVCNHAKWSLRREVRIALLRHAKTPMSHALEFAQSFSPAILREILKTSRMPAMVKARIGEQVAGRGQGSKG